MEQKCFISYTTYREDGAETFNDIIFTNPDEITPEWLEDIQESLLHKVNDVTTSKSLYHATQIINIVKL